MNLNVQRKEIKNCKEVAQQKGTQDASVRLEQRELLVQPFVWVLFPSSRYIFRCVCNNMKRNKEGRVVKEVKVA